MACLSSPNCVRSGPGPGRPVTPRAGQEEGLRIGRGDEHGGPAAIYQFPGEEPLTYQWCPGPCSTDMERPRPLHHHSEEAKVRLSAWESPLGAAVVCLQDGHRAFAGTGCTEVLNKYSDLKGWEEAWRMPINCQEDPNSCPDDKIWSTGHSHVTQVLSSRTGVPSAPPGTWQNLSLRDVWWRNRTPES